MMNKILKNISFALISLILITLIFGSGYFVGHNNEKFLVPKSFKNTVNASSDVDFYSFWKVWNLVEDKFISASSTKEITNQEKVWGAISGMVNSLGDPYTIFLPPAENESFQESIEGSFAGVGMEVGIADGILTVVTPLKNTPAEKAGIESGDKILAIDGMTTQDIGIDEAVSKIKGPVGTQITLTIFRIGGKEPFDLVVTRDVINIPTLETELRNDGIFVISLYNFSAGAESEFRAALREFILSKKSRLLLDLRGNPGGFLDSAVDIASWFLPAGKVIVQEDFGDEVKEFRSRGQNIFNDNLKMVVLVNQGSASAAEILAGALQEHKIATVVGTKTFGKGSVQELIQVTPETSLKVTIARWLTPFGKSISDGGLLPDIVIDKAPEGIELFDYQTEEAIKILKEI